MEETGQLSEKIRKCLDRHLNELAERQTQIDSTMKEMLDQRERFAAAAHRLVESVVHPRMVELSHQFDNAFVSDRHSGTDFYCSCEFAHTPRFPATVTLDVGLFPEETGEKVAIRSSLDILPTLMEYKRNDETTLPLEGSDEAVGR